MEVRNMRSIFGTSVLGGVLFALGLVLIGCDDAAVNRSNPPAAQSSSSSGSFSGKAYTIVQQQKAAFEEVTRKAVELIKADRMPEVRQLCKSRWNDLATLLTDVTFDSDLTSGEKEAIVRVLRQDMEGITEILAKYERLYGGGDD